MNYLNQMLKTLLLKLPTTNKNKIMIICGILIFTTFCVSYGQKIVQPYYLRPSLPIADHITKTVHGNKGVILIIIDALRPDHLGHFGYTRNTSPMIDELASQGVSFETVIANAPWTRPSTASIFTSKNASRHGVQTEKSKLSESFVTLAETLQKEGIKTGAVIGNGNVNSLWGFAQGFDEYIDTKENWNGLPKAKEVFESGKKWIIANKKKRFFLTLFLIDPHSPYKSPPYYEKLFTKGDTHKILRTPQWQYRKKMNAGIVSDMVGLYDGAIRYCDDMLQKFVTDLKKMGIYDETTLIVTADHGEGFGEHQRFRHAYHFYEEFIRVPLIIKSSTIQEKGKCSKQLVELIDLYPSIVEIFGLPVPEFCDGMSIFEHSVKGGNKRFLYSEYNNFGLHNQCIRNSRWKLIYEAKADIKEFNKYIKDKTNLPFFLLDKEKFELYDLFKDPFETNDVSVKQPQKTQEMLTHLKKFLDHETFQAEEIERSTVDPKILNSLKSIGYFQ